MIGAVKGYCTRVAGNTQFHLRPRIETAPDGQLAVSELRALPHPAQPEISFPPSRAQHPRFDPLSAAPLRRKSCR